VSAWGLLALLLAGPGTMPEAAAVTAMPIAGGPVRATYALSWPDPRALPIRTHRAAGYVQRVRSMRGGRIEVTVLVDAAPLRVSSSWPPDRGLWPPGISRWAEHDDECEATPVVQALGRELAEGAGSELEAADRILEWVSTRIRPEDVPAHDDSAAATLGTLSGSCVGRSRLTVALLRSAGLPARTVHGLVVPRDLSRNETLGSAEFVLHRFVECWLTGVGWTPSDPGESLHVVDTRHLVLALDHEDYDPEAQRELSVTLISAPGPLVSAGGDGAQRLVRRDLAPASAGAGRRQR
jgi:hypothetical protein